MCARLEEVLIMAAYIFNAKYDLILFDSVAHIYLSADCQSCNLNSHIERKSND